jgi:hypothetical protein
MPAQRTRGDTMPLQGTRSSSSSRRRRLATIGTATALALALLNPAHALAATSAKGAPPLPTVGEFDSTRAQPLTGAELTALQKRQARAAAYYTTKMNRLRQMQAAGTDIATATTGNLAEPYYQQINEDFCGAATTVMISDYLGFGWSGHSSTYQQDQAGYWVKTDGAYKNSSGTIIFPDSSGTAWYGVDNVPSYPYGSYYPIMDWLNYKNWQQTGGPWYQAVPLPDTPSSSDQSYFLNALVLDVDSDHPEADNQYSISGYQLPYQPNGTWRHWWSARGYQNSGHTTGINDPAAFANGVEHWVTTTGGAHTVVIALGGRGYIW